MPELPDPTTSRPTPVGGQLTTGSDEPRPLGVLADLLAQPLRDASSVLLLGPTAAALTESRPDASVLVRQVADAERLARSAARVLVGGLDRLPEEQTAQLVILLDPPERVLTPDSPGMSHVGLVERAARHAAPGGRLLAFVPGALGLDDDAAVVHLLDGDDAWWVGTPGYDDRPPALSELPWPSSYFVVSTNEVPTLAAAPALTGTEDGRALLRLATSTDPAARRSLDAGVLQALADGWLVQRGDGPTPGAAWTHALGGDAELSPAPTSGDSLEARLLTALRLGRQTELRALLTTYADFVRVLPAGERASAVPRVVISSGDGLALYRPSPIDATPTPEVAIAHGLLDLAHATTAPGAAAGFPAEFSADALAAELGKLVGLGAAVWAQARAHRQAVDLPDRSRRDHAPADAATAARIAELSTTLTERDVQLRELRDLLKRQSRRVRALEHAMATEHGPLARRALFLMTAPTSRLVEAARSRFRR